MIHHRIMEPYFIRLLSKLLHQALFALRSDVALHVAHCVVDGLRDVLHVLRVQATEVDASLLQQVDLVLLDEVLHLLG